MSEISREVWGIRAVANGFGVTLPCIRNWIGNPSKWQKRALPCLEIVGQRQTAERFIFFPDEVLSWANEHDVWFKPPKGKR